MVLVHLPKTDQQIVSVWEMLKQKIAPIGGEILTGGDLPFASMRPSFGDLTGKSTYDLDSVMRSYARKPVDSSEHSLDEVNHHIYEMGRAMGGFRVTQALIAATRFYQKGGDISQVEGMGTKEEFNEMLQQLQRLSLNRYFALKLIAQYVVNDNENAIDLGGFADEFEGYCADNKIDLESLQDLKPLESFLKEKGFSLLDKPRQAGDREGSMSVLRDIGLGNFHHPVQVALQQPQELLREYASHQALIDKEIEKIKKHFALMEEVVYTKCPNPIQDEEGNLSDPFPLIFFTKKDEVMEKVMTEFRATKPLKLGEDIPYIGTPRAYIPRLQAYIEKHGLLNVKPIAFEDMVHLVP